MDTATLDQLEGHLVAVSRSFALSIQALDRPLRERVGIAYLICRILDTIEDCAQMPGDERAALLERCAVEMFVGDRARREPLVAELHARFAAVSVTDGERALLKDMALVLDCYDEQPAAAVRCVTPNVVAMARGMARFCRGEIGRGLDGFGTVGELVQYCHYVAGVVGTLLTDLFLLHLDEIAPTPADRPTARLAGELHGDADAFGLGLQLTNILKNVGDDARRGVSFAPRPFLDRIRSKLEPLVDAPQTVHARRFVLDLTNLVLPFLDRSIRYTASIPAVPAARSIRHFLVLPVVFALRTLRLGIAHPALAFHEQKLKISREVVGELRREVDQKLDSAADTTALLERERDAVAEALQAAWDADPALAALDTCSHASPAEPPSRTGAAGASPGLEQVIDLFVTSFADDRERRDTMAAITLDGHAPLPLPQLHDRPSPGRRGSADDAVARAVACLHAQRRDDHFSGVVEAHAGLNGQLLALSHALDWFDAPTQAGLAAYIRSHQRPDGAWALDTDPAAPAHLGITISCWMGLVAHADPADAPRVARAEAWIRKAALREPLPVEPRFLLRLFGCWPHNGDLPTIDPLLALIPTASIFSRADFACWIRVALVPMSVIAHTGYRVAVPGLTPARVAALGLRPPSEPDPQLVEQRTRWEQLVARTTEKIALPRSDLERLAIAHAERWIRQHQDRDGTWGGIYPGIQYGVLALLALGYDPSDPAIAAGMRGFRAYLADMERDVPDNTASAGYPHGRGLVIQSCESPVWDTAWALYALAHAGEPLTSGPNRASIDWLVDQQILVEGDWAARTQLGFGGGWAFQYANDWYPDVDDTALVLDVLLRALQEDRRDRNAASRPAWAGRDRAASAVRIGIRWLLAMQNADGGWAAFERGVDNGLMREVPLNDLDNWLDPSTADVTGRVLMALGTAGLRIGHPVVDRALTFLREDQRATSRGSGPPAWWGRWGVNYLYGTWSVLVGLRAVGMPSEDRVITTAAAWLAGCQNHDGGYGESTASYADPSQAGRGASTPSQTAWSVLALDAAGIRPEAASRARPVAWLRAQQRPDGGWTETAYTGTGFAKQFYLRYHLYRLTFPLLALTLPR